MEQRFGKYLLFLPILAICQYSDDLARNVIFPIGVATFDEDPTICLQRGLPDGLLKRKIEIPCDVLNETCSGYTASSEKSKAIIIAFRGSSGALEVPIEFLSVIFQKQVKFPGGGLVAEFFYSAFLGLWSSGMKDDFLSLRQQYPDYDVWVIGGSLGGALASMAAGYLTQNDLVSGNQLKLWTFGEPRNGDSTFANQMDDKVPFAYRVVHNNDLVPQIPLNIENYEHHRTEIWYPNDMATGEPFIVCRGNEDRNCSAGIPPSEWSNAAHTHYFDIDVSKYQAQGCVFS